MKYWSYFIQLAVIVILMNGCQTYTSMPIETIVPAKVDFPGNFNKIIFINLATDVNGDKETDSLLYNMITEEMSFGFIDVVEQSVGVDSTNFYYLKGFPNRNRFYEGDTISWKYLDRLFDKSNADIFIVLDSMNVVMRTDRYTEFGSYPEEFYRFREIVVDVYWSLYDIIDKRRLDRFHYNDTLFWEYISYSKAEVDAKMPSVTRSVKETSYFAAADYANRILPGWQGETRYYFIRGNKDFKLAAKLVAEDNWEDASKLWEKHAADIDNEIASRACYNLALFNELKGNIDLAIAWAQKSKQIKNKPRTRYYISTLKTRKKDIDKLQKQIY